MKSAQKLQTSVAYSTEFRAHAVQLVFKHRHEYQSEAAALRWIANRLGCSSEILGAWFWQAQYDVAALFGQQSAERAKIQELEREVRDLRQANEFLKRVSTNFAASEFDRSVRN